MSEFSCSYHLKTESVDDCVNLIKKANTTGFVFPARDGWVSFVVDVPDYVFSKSLIDANDGVLLNFINAEDHGWSFEVFNNSSKVCKFESYYCEEDDEDMDEETDGDIDEDIDEDLFDEPDELSFDNIGDYARYFTIEYNFEKCVESWDGVFDQNQSRMLDRVFAMDKNTPPKERVTAWDFANGMGLYFYEWVSYSYISPEPPTVYGEYKDLKITEVR